jgi:hypothetical protein
MSLRPRTVALVSALALLAVACGSTAQVGSGVPAAVGAPSDAAGGVTQGGTDDFGLGLGGTPTAQPRSGQEPTALGPGFASGSTSGGAPLSPQASATTGTSAGATNQPSSTGRERPAAAPGFTVAPGTPGVTDTEIFIGFTYAKNAGSANESIGFEEFSAGDPKRNHQVLVDHINATGGIAGRELVPVFHVSDQASNQTIAEREQQTCATWTQDNEVFAGVIAAATDTLRQCMANAGVPLINSQGLGLSDDRTLADFPGTVEPTNLSLNPMAKLTVTGLDAEGYFAPDTPATPVRVGVITFDFPSFRRAVERDMVPELERRGLDVVGPVFVKWAERTSDAGEVSAQLSNTVLRFRSEGVTHVLIFDATAFLTVVFMTNAEPQGYRPNYGFNTQNGGQLLVGSVPEAQLEGTKQVGWIPMFDVLDVPEWPAQQACLRLYAEADMEFDSKNAKGIALLTCDLYDVLRRGIENAPAPLSQRSVIAGFERLGTSFESALVKDVRLEPGRRYGVTTYRSSEYRTDCGCFRYTGGPFPIE